MKNSLILLLAGTALFAAGYSVRGFSDPAAVVSPAQAGPVSAALPRRESPHPATAGKGNEGSPDSSSIRPFIPGRPFAKGHAREWLLGLTARLHGDRRNYGIAMAGNLQAFMTMDDDSVRETLAALEELIAIADAENPDRRRNPNGDGKLDSLLELSMMRLVQTQPDEAFAVLDKNWRLNDSGTRLLVLGILAAKDLPRAEQLVLSMHGERRKDAIESLLHALSGQDPQAALALAVRHPEAGGDRFRGKILEDWVQTDPQPAMAAAAASNNTEIIRNTIEEWAKRDPAAATRWAASYEGTGYVTARAMVLERRAREDPQAALAEYAALQQAASDPKELHRLTGALADAFAGKDVNAARAWAEALPDAELRNRALHQVTEEWVKRDAPAASEWIRSLPAGQLRDGAAKELTSAIARRDPAGAFEWARTIENAKLRQDALSNVLRNWRDADPDAAKAALESLPHSDSDAVRQ